MIGRLLLKLNGVSEILTNLILHWLFHEFTILSTIELSLVTHIMSNLLGHPKLLSLVLVRLWLVEGRVTIGLCHNWILHLHILHTVLSYASLRHLSRGLLTLLWLMHCLLVVIHILQKLVAIIY